MDDEKGKKDEAALTRVSMEDLILVGIYLVLKEEETCTFERLVSECFSQFPKVFGFKRYPEWPDSLKLDRPLRKLRENGFIVGSMKDHFLLTEFGEQIAIHTIESLDKGGTRARKTARVSPGRSAEDRLIAYLKTSPLFADFLRSPASFSISEPQFRNVLRCTLETPLRVVKQNLEYYKKLAEAYGEKDLIDFLSFCEKQLMERP